MTLLLFCSPLNPKVLWERYRNSISRHGRITNGGTSKDTYNDTLLLLEAKLILMKKSLHDFLEMLFALLPIEMMRVNLQLVTELDYNKDVLYGYIDQNLPRFNICQETIITLAFNAVTQGEGVVFFLNGLGGLGKTFVYNMLLASV